MNLTAGHADKTADINHFLMNQFIQDTMTSFDPPFSEVKYVAR